VRCAAWSKVQSVPEQLLHTVEAPHAPWPSGFLHVILPSNNIALAGSGVQSSLVEVEVRDGLRDVVPTDSQIERSKEIGKSYRQHLAANRSFSHPHRAPCRPKPETARAHRRRDLVLFVDIPLLSSRDRNHLRHLFHSPLRRPYPIDTLRTLSAPDTSDGRRQSRSKPPSCALWRAVASSPCSPLHGLHGT
jgi:hypothetical protein